MGRATIVRDVFHQFSPHGISGVVVIAESHLAIHTWPEHGYAAVDLFSLQARNGRRSSGGLPARGFRLPPLRAHGASRGRI